MAKHIYVGNLHHSTTEDQLFALFSKFGEVTSVTIVRDRLSGRPLGCAFIQMKSDEATRTAITSLNGTALNGRPMKVSEARVTPPGTSVI